MDTHVRCIGLLSAPRPCGAATSNLHRTVFGRRMYTSDVRIPEFLIHISSARHFASMLTPTITCLTDTSFAAYDEVCCNLDDRFLVQFAMSFLDTRI